MTTGSPGTRGPRSRQVGEVICVHLCLEVTACELADMHGTNGTSPPVPAGILLREKAPPMSLHLRRCPGRSNKKGWGITMRCRRQCKQRQGTLSDQ